MPTVVSFGLKTNIGLTHRYTLAGLAVNERLVCDSHTMDCLEEPRKAYMGTRLVFILVSPLTEALSSFGTTWEWRTFCVTGGHCCQSMLVWSGEEYRETPVWDSSQNETMCTWTMCCRPFKVWILNPLYILYNNWQKEKQLLPVIAIEVNLDHLLLECILR